MKGKSLDNGYTEDIFERFHYTDIHGLLGILESSTLRMCSYRTMNDSMELKWSIQKKLNAIQKKVSEPLQYEFLTEIENSLKSVPLHAYLICFSSEKDLLSQWRAYGDDGKGVAIGFDLEATHFDHRPPRVEPYEADMLAGYFDVLYDRESLQVGINNYIELFNKYIDILKQKPSEKKRFADQIAVFLLQDSVAHKNPAFKEENECRIINLTYQNYNGNFIGTTSGIEFKASGKKLTSYFEYKFPKNIVTEIVLGPKSEIDEKELYLFLDKNGYGDHVIITHSSASYR